MVPGLQHPEDFTLASTLACSELLYPHCTGPVFGLCKFQTGGPHVRARSTCGSSCNWLMSGHILSAVITLLTTSGRPKARTTTEHTRRPRSRVFRFCKCGVQRQRRGRNRRISARQWSAWRVSFPGPQPAVCGGLMRRPSPRPERLLPRPHSRLHREDAIDLR